MPRNYGAIAEIDPANGALMRVHRSGQNSGNAFVNAHRLAVYVLYFQELNRRGLGWFDLNDQGFRSWVGGKDLYGWRLTPIGVDGRGNLYTWKDSALARIDPQGGVEVLASLDNLVPGADGSLYGSRFEAGQGMATVWVKAQGPGRRRPSWPCGCPRG